MAGIKNPDLHLSLTRTRRQWGLIASALDQTAKVRRRNDARKPFIPEQGHINHNLVSADVLEESSREIRKQLAEDAQ